MKTIKLYNRDMDVSADLEAKLVDYVLVKLAAVRKPEDASISWLVEQIRMELKINFPTSHNDAQTFFEAIGFKIGAVPQKNNPRLTRSWFVTI